MEDTKIKGMYFFWIVFAFVMYGIYNLYEPFLLDLLIASMFCVASFGMKNKILKFVRYEVLASLISTIILVGLLVLPIFFAFQSLSQLIFNTDVNWFISIFENLKTQFLALLDNLPVVQARVREELSNVSAISIFNNIFNLAHIATTKSINFIVDMCFIIVFLFFLYLYGLKLKNLICDLIPLTKKYTDEIITEVFNTILVVSYTLIINIILQGVSFGILMFFMGFYGVLLGILYGIASLIPVVGGSIVWIPVCLYMIYLGDYVGALIVALYSLIFIAFVIDSIIKPFLIKFITIKILKISTFVNEFLIFFAIFAGLISFGFWGVLIGPIITTLFIAMLGVYKKIFKNP